MKTEPMERVVAITILDITAHRMTHIGRMDTDLVLPPGVKAELHKRMVHGTTERPEMGNGILASIVHGRRVGDIGTVVLEPVGYRAFILLHFATHYGYIAAVVDRAVPVFLKGEGCLLVFGINHQPRSVTIKTMDHMSLTTLARLAEIVIEHSLHVQRGVSGGHTKDSRALFDDDEIAVLIDYADIPATEGVVALGLRHGHLHSWTQGIVEPSDGLAVNTDAPPFERILDLIARLPLDMGQQPLQQGGRLVHIIAVVVGPVDGCIVLLHFEIIFL